MKKDARAHKRVGYVFLGLALCFLLFSFGSAMGSTRFWIMSITSLLLWVIAAFFIMHASEKRVVFFKIVLTIVVMILAPMAFIYLEASRGFALIKNEPFTQFLVFEAVAAFSFIISAAGLAKTLSALHQKKRIRG